MDRYTQRTAEWGNWGITFLDVQPDRSKKYGLIIGTLYFPIGTRGPCDGFIGSSERMSYQDVVRNWMDDGTLPAGLVPFTQSQ